MYPDVEAVFVDTGLEYPEIKRFVKTFDNVTILRPDISFVDVIKQYGYPMISKDVSGTVYEVKKSIQKNGLEKTKEKVRYKKLVGEFMYNGTKSKFNKDKYLFLLNEDYEVSDVCCRIMKKRPAHIYQTKTGKKPFLGTMASESQMRQSAWIRTGCNAFNGTYPKSNPMSFWTEQDVLSYIYTNNISIAKPYGKVVQEDYQLDMFQQAKPQYHTTGVSRTGCIFCGFGAHLDKSPNRFERLKKSHPKQYDYCMNGGEFVNGIWKPNKRGLGMDYVLSKLDIKH
jgi:hypothetical protein